MHSTPRYLFIVCFLILATCCQAAVADTFPWRASIDAAIQEASRENKLVLIHFWDYRCPPCLRLEENVFQRKDVLRAIEEHYVPVKINVTDAPRLSRRYGIRQWPTDIILTPQQQPLYRGVSKQSPQEFISLLDQLALETNANEVETAVAVNPVGKPQSSGPSTAPIHDDRQSVFRIADGPAHPFVAEHFATNPPSSHLEWPTIPESERTSANNRVTPGKETTSRSLTVAPTYSPPPKRTGPITGHNVTAVSAVAAMEQRPTSPITLGLDGYCPVTLSGSTGRFPQWQKGHSQWGAIHRGQLYLFAGAGEQAKFLRAPDRYSPILSGRDIVRLLKHREHAPGKRRHGVTYQDRIYLFTDEHSLQEFRKAPNFYAREAFKRAPNWR